MMNRILMIWVLSTIAIGAFSQPYGNEWIDYSKTYYKIKVGADGIYRIPYATLNDAIANLSAISGSNFILFRNGVQVPVYITTTGTFGPGDYIEFYGRKTDGSSDTPLYQQSSWQPHTERSLFTDTAAYFLTWNTSTSNPRINDFINDLNNLPAKENYFWHTSTKVLSSSFSGGRPYDDFGSTLYNSIFDNGEGFVGPDYTSTQSQMLSTPHAYLSGPSAADFSTVVVSSSTKDHHLRISVNSVVVKDTMFNGFRLNRINYAYPVTSLQSNNTVLYEALAATIDRNAVAILEMNYPRQFNFDGQSTFSFTLPGNPSSRKYIEVSNFNDKGTQPIIYDLTNGLRISSVDPPGTSPLRFALPISATPRQLFLRSNDASDIRTVNQLEAQNFTNFSNVINQGQFVIITHESLLDDGIGGNPVEDYRQHRDQAFNPASDLSAKTVLIGELYDQFYYGIAKHPLSIKNFARFALDQWTVTPEFIFLIGKGREYVNVRTSVSDYHQCLLPTFGDPGSDNLLTAISNINYPDIPTGRLAAATTDDVYVYLNKVKQYEAEQQKKGDFFQTLDEKAWMKNFLHFGGGTSLFEQTTFRSFLISYQKKVEGVSYGAQVDSFYKRSAAPIATLQSDQIKAIIDNGVSMITFFGHSSPGSFDLSFDEPENYTNFGKYPVILSNGCFAGYIYGKTPGISERFVLVEDKGAIAFMATTGLSLSSSLHIFSTNFYNNLNRDMYGGTLGEFVQKTAEIITTTYFHEIYHLLIAHEMTLHGDPALKLNNYEEPDYAIEPDQVTFEPQVVSTASDSFNVHITVTNLGKAIEDSISISLTRIFENGSQLFYKKRVLAPTYQSVVTFRIPTMVEEPGFTAELINTVNRFSIFVDSDNEVDPELSEINNTLPNAYFSGDLTVNIITDDVFPVYPYDYSIVGTTDIILKTSTSNAFATDRTYILQLDTSELFDSPYRKQFQATKRGGVINWPVTILDEDSMVYYWRVTMDSTTGQGYNWHGSSFVLLKNQGPGWNQSHYYQLLNADYANIYLDNDRTLKFVDDIKEIDVTTGLGISAGGNLADDELGWKLNGALQHRWRMGGCGGLAGLTIAVLDEGTGLPWASVNTGAGQFGQFGNYHCNYHYYLQYGFNFRTVGLHPELSIPWSQVLVNFLDTIPDGNYVLIYSHNNPDYTNWDASLVNRLINMGASSILPLSQGSFPSGPYIFFTQKGNSGYPHVEQVGNGYSQSISEKIIFSGTWNEGYMTSPLIGPAQEWTSLLWNSEAFELPDFDEQRIDIFGVKPNGIEVNLGSVHMSKDTTLNFVDAATYPYLRLRYFTKDDTSRTPAQLSYWRVLYQDVPDAAINPSLHFVYSGDSIEQGKPVELEIAVENLTAIGMDSLLVQYSTLDATNNSSIDEQRYRPLNANDTLHLDYRSETVDFRYIGNNLLIVEVNPGDDQPEKHRFNNIGILNYKVSGDVTNPLLDVTFDGVRILDGDIVSANPLISITLTDENQFLALDDTSLFDIQFKYPDGSLDQVLFTDPDVDFFPANSGSLAEGNQARIEVNPMFETDGTYELIVYDQDKSGNSSASGKLAYRISFEIITKPGITNVLNYPNPFTTSTQFVFTLTGVTIPTFMKIQIMTIKGKVVREIFQDELGPIHVGRNITEFSWDGTDQYGDPLANGVYFYRVVTDLDGEDLDHINTSADQYFKKGFGKMVLIR